MKFQKRDVEKGSSERLSFPLNSINFDNAKGKVVLQIFRNFFTL